MKLILVYNANSDFFSSSLDFIHKIVSPKTYKCELCALTHGSFKEKPEWKNFVDQTAIKLVFHHIGDFEERYRTSYDYPVVVMEDDDQLKVVFNKTQLGEMKSTQELIQAIESLAEVSTKN